MILALEAGAEVYHSRESALRLAFADADTVVKRQLFLDDDEARKAEERARVKLPSRLVTMYVGQRGGEVTGYAFIETHQVRTLPETILIVIDPGGKVRAVHILAFHEPREYGASDSWLSQFEGRALSEDLSLRGDIAGIAGATLTATAITAAVRRTLAVFETSVGVDDDGPEGGGPGSAGSTVSGGN
jgi:Na+-translocating ferredoxin:NAD+ oxidoreductase RnfG subunit